MLFFDRFGENSLGNHGDFQIPEMGIRLLGLPFLSQMSVML
jgi:hypothetical protein